jgi:hypothetical protein
MPVEQGDNWREQDEAEYFQESGPFTVIGA